MDVLLINSNLIDGFANSEIGKSIATIIYGLLIIGSVALGIILWLRTNDLYSVSLPFGIELTPIAFSIFVPIIIIGIATILLINGFFHWLAGGLIASALICGAVYLYSNS